MLAKFQNRSLELPIGDIAAQGVDAIANAANSRLAGDMVGKIGQTE